MATPRGPDDLIDKLCEAAQWVSHGDLVDAAVR